MFNSEVKRLKEENELLRRRNSELLTCLQASFENHKNDFIVKMVPQLDSHFYLNGEFVVDETRAVYGSHILTFSEAVLWKAGKEQQRRNQQAEIDTANKERDEAKAAYERLKEEMSKLEEYESLTRGEMSQQIDECSKLREELSELKKEYDSIIEQNAAYASDVENYIQKLENSNLEIKHLQNKLEGVTNHDVSKAIKTPYGEIK